MARASDLHKRKENAVTDLPSHLVTTTMGNLDANLAWVDETVVGVPVVLRDRPERTRRAVVALVAELAKGPLVAHPALTAQLRHRIGWPSPDTPDAEVLRGAGRVGTPVATVVKNLEAWPVEHHRTVLIEQLRALAARAGANATAISPSYPDTNTSGRHRVVPQ